MDYASFSNAIWDGERDVASRSFTDIYIKKVDAAGKDTYPKHSKCELALQHWILQDAIEFAEFVINATINSMKFQKRPKTVGGPVDILLGSGGISQKESIENSQSELIRNNQQFAWAVMRGSRDLLGGGISRPLSTTENSMSKMSRMPLGKAFAGAFTFCTFSSLRQAGTFFSVLSVANRK